MKTIAIVSFVLLSLIIVSSASAAEQCSVSRLDIENIASEATTTAKLTYYFVCLPAASGQVNKMIVTVPYQDASNVEASDWLGSMKVFEGPSYASATRSDTDATIGSFFRKAIVLDENEVTAYILTLEFQSNLFAKKNEQTYTLSPKGLGASPKITIVGAGVTEMMIPVEEISYKLTLPTGSAVVSSPGGCSLSEGKVSCTGLTPASLDALEVKWTGTGPSVWLTKVRDIAKQVPGAFTNIFNKVYSIFKR